MVFLDKIKNSVKEICVIRKIRLKIRIKWR
jgi:hypothetical protein